MVQSHEYDGDPLLTVRRYSTELTQSADHGAVGTGGFAIEDEDGDIEIVGQKDYRYEEDECANTRTFQGFIAERTYGRRAGESERGPHTGAARGIGVAVVDINDRLNHKLIVEGGKRPPESVQSRLQWLLGSAYAPFADLGRVSYPNDSMDKADYRYQYAGDVLADCALAAGTGWNYFIANYGDGPELVFRNDNVSTADSSDLRISNVLEDVDSDIYALGGTKTLAPTRDAILRRDPSLVHSKHAESYAKGTVVENMASTAATFNGERGGSSSNSNIKRAAQARRAARRELRAHSIEDDIIEVTIQVPASAVNLAYQGFRIQAKFSHLATEGYGDFTWMRILERTIRPMRSDISYELALKLAPQEAGSDVSCPYEATESQMLYPLGRVGDGWGEEVTPNPSDGIVSYLRPGIFYPTTPSPGSQCLWHFPALGTGGAGTIDYAGDCVQNTLQFIVVGPGTLTVQTEIYGGSPRPIAASWGPSPNAYVNYVGAFTSGDVIEVEITESCASVIRIGDGSGSPCGGKWGWSQAEWVAS